MTDAGWFTGGWPDGAGNWDPDPEKYPEGMGPVAAAAKERGMAYGLSLGYELDLRTGAERIVLGLHLRVGGEAERRPEKPSARSGP